MRAGTLRDQVTLQSPSTSRDAVGQRSGGWVDQGTVFAEVKPLSGREFFEAAQTQQENQLRVRIRRNDSVLSTWRVLWEGRAYDIVSAIRVGRDTTELMIREGGADGR